MSGMCVLKNNTRIADEAGLSRTYLFKAKTELETKGWIAVDEFDNVSPVKGRFDKLTVGVEKKEVAEELSVKNTLSDNLTPDCQLNGHRVSVNPTGTKVAIKGNILLTNNKTTNKEEKSIVSPAVRPVPPDVQVIFDYWKLKCEHPTAKLSPKREKKIRDRLKDSFTIDDLKAAIDGIRCSDFHMGREERNSKIYDDLELIFRDIEHVEMFINMPGNNGGGKVYDPNAILERRRKLIEQRNNGNPVPSNREGPTLLRDVSAIRRATAGDGG